MKKLMLLSCLVLLPLATIAQDPEVFGTWNLYRIEIKFSQGLQISDVEPAIIPWLTIHENLDFEGFGACNSFSGSLEYIPNNRFRPVNYEETLLDCETQFHDDIEDEYFGYFKFENVFGFWISTGSDGLRHLFISTGAPGFNLEFVRSQLSSGDHQQGAFTIYPNPVQDLLFISSEGAAINKIAIYDVNGEMVLQHSREMSKVNVSDLSTGIYFVEITSEGGKTVRRFIKG